MIKACIFDLDGTVVNSLNSIAFFCNQTLNKYNLPSIETEKYKTLVGNGASLLVKRMIDYVGGNQADFESIYTDYCTAYDNNFLHLSAPYDGVVEMLSALKEKGIKTAVLSNKPHPTTSKISHALFGSELIDLCFGASEKFPLKPDPSGVFAIMEQLNVKKEECLYIGDTSTDMQTAKNSGLFAVGVLWGFRSRDELESAGADAIIEHPRELLDLIK